MQHRGSDPAHAGWTRAYVYHEASLIEDGIREPVRKTSNRLTSTTVNPAGNTPQPEAYQHDAHGNMVRMPHLGVGLPGPNMHWDYKDQLRQTDLGGGWRGLLRLRRLRPACAQRCGRSRRAISPKSASTSAASRSSASTAVPLGTTRATLERETLHVMDDKQRIALVETRTLPRTPDPNDPLLLIRYQFRQSSRIGQPGVG
jgi:hypothetical protein